MNSRDFFYNRSSPNLPPGPVLDSGGLVNVKEFGAVGDGVTDDTTAFLLAIEEAGPVGGEVRMVSGATYKITNEIDLLGARLRGDGSQTIRQHTAGKGVFVATVDGSEVHGVMLEYVPTRTAPSGMYKGLSAFQRLCGIWTEASNVKFTNLKFKNLFGGVVMRGPVVTATYPLSGLTVGSVTTLNCPAHGLTLSGRGYLTGVAGPVLVNNIVATVVVIDPNTLTIAINSSAMPAYVSGGQLNLYDFTPQARNLVYRDAHSIGCDFMLTGSQYNGGLVENLSWESPTNLSVPPHMIYVQNAGTGPTNEEGFVENFTFRNCSGSNSAVPSQPLLKFSNIKDSTAVDCTIKDSYGILWGKAYRCRTVNLGFDHLDGTVASEAIRFSDVGEDNEVVGGNLLCGSYGVKTTDAVVRTKVFGTRVIDNAPGGSSLGKMFRAEDSSSMILHLVSGHSKQANSDYLIGTSGTATIDAIVASRTGGPGIVRAAAGTSVTMQFDPTFVPLFAENNTSIRRDGTVTESRLINGLTGLRGSTSCVLKGLTTAGTQVLSTQAGSQWSAHNRSVSVKTYLRFTTFDAATSGVIRFDCLPFVARSATVGGSDNLGAIAVCSTALNMAGLPSSGPFALYAEAIMGTTEVAFFYMTISSGTVVKTYLTHANIVTATRIGFELTYLRD